jgi:hypothetical protein
MDSVLTMRWLPSPGDAVWIVHLGSRDAAEVTAVEGRRVWVRDADGFEHAFELSRLTARFVRVGEPYYGARLVPARDD